MVDSEIERLKKEIEYLKKKKIKNRKEQARLNEKRQLQRKLLELKYEKPIEYYKTIKTTSKKTYDSLSSSLSNFLRDQKIKREKRNALLKKIQKKIKNNTATDKERRYYNYYVR